MRTARRTTGGALALVTAGLLLVTGCSGGDGGAASRPAAEGADQLGAGSTSRDSGSGGSGGLDAGGNAADGTSTSARVLPAERDIIYRGQLTVRVKDVAIAASRAESMIRAVDGVVFAEETTSDPHPDGADTATMTLRVPPSDFRSLLDRLGELGTPLSRSQTAQDVTTEVVDVESRVASQERSVARIRALLSEAATIGEVVQIESELARREADLESLEAQLARLDDLTELATIELSLVERSDPRPVKEDEDLGFLSGLSGGWDAFVQVVLIVVTVLGAVLPFLVALALLGLPALALLRRRRPAPAPEPPAV